MKAIEVSSKIAAIALNTKDESTKAELLNLIVMISSKIDGLTKKGVKPISLNLEQEIACSIMDAVQLKMEKKEMISAVCSENKCTRRAVEEVLKKMINDGRIEQDREARGKSNRSIIYKES